jgi:uncharacterized RDD family membrane protein YckC
MSAAILSIKTPEGIVFSQELAGPVIRFVAWLVDAACVGAGFAALRQLSGVLAMISPNFAMAFNILGYFAISIGYGIVLEWNWRGQTIGKRLMRLRVVDAEGLRLQFDQIVTRNLLRFVDSLPVLYFIGGTASWLNRKCQRLGDIAGNTVVIREPRVAEPDLDQLLAGKFNSLRRHPHLTARLRKQVSPAEASLALQALLRREEFEPAARVELFGDLAAYFRGKTEFPTEDTDGMADEQYLRNVVDIVYRSRNEPHSGKPEGGINRDSSRAG